MQISVIFMLAAEEVAGAASGWFDMVVATGNRESFRGRRGQGES